MIKIIKGDITTLAVDCIVNACNPAGLGGGGVDGAIHRAAGPGLKTECMLLPEQEPDVRIRIGQVFITDGYDLPAKHVMHVVGPIFARKVGPLRPGEVNIPGIDPKDMLRETFKHCLEDAHHEGYKSIAIPAISCGVYGCPTEVGAQMAAEACAYAIRTKQCPKDVTFVLFTDLDYDVWRATFYPSRFWKTFPAE